MGISTQIFGSTIVTSRPKRLSDMDMLLGKVQQCAGKRLDITGAKEWLRSFGLRGKSAASRMGKVSKMGNLQSHPDALQLAVEIMQLAEEASVQHVSDENIVEVPVEVEQVVPVQPAQAPKIQIAQNIALTPQHIVKEEGAMEKGETDETEMLEAGEELAWITKEIRNIYQEHNPEKLADILQQLRTKYAGQELAMYTKVCKKYGIERKVFQAG